MNCQHCGANLSLEDMTRHNCPYCKNVLKHHAQAAEHAALVNKVLEQRIGAQYPGTPPGMMPQIGYGMGAGMQNMEQFQQYHMNQGLKRAGWITAVAFIVPIVMMLVIGGITVAWMLFSF
jgi:hypothetical protein